MDTETIDIIKKTYWKKSTHVAAHEYIVEQKEPGLHARLKAIIDKYGYYETFKGYRYKYYDIGEYQYWAMGNILNRATKPKSKTSYHQSSLKV